MNRRGEHGPAEGRGPAEFRAPIEFLETAGSGRVGNAEAVGAEPVVGGPGFGGGPGRWVLLLVAVGMATWLLGTGDRSTRPDPVAPSPTVAPISPMLDHGGAIGGAGPGVDTASLDSVDVAPWPEPPLDRDPFVVRIPGGDAVPSGLSDQAIVYINAAGDPTVVSFATGDVYRIDVASTRIHETFAVEGGEVRSLDGANRGLPEATQAAVVFHTRRSVDPAGGDAIGETPGRSLGLCASDPTCADAVVIGDVLVETYDPERHTAVRDVIDDWTLAGRWIVSPEGFRIPTPAGFIWVLTPSSL